MKTWIHPSLLENVSLDYVEVSHRFDETHSPYGDKTYHNYLWYVNSTKLVSNPFLPLGARRILTIRQFDNIYCVSNSTDIFCRVDTLEKAVQVAANVLGALDRGLIVVDYDRYLEDYRETEE
jgi:hypothetical protein